MIRCVLLISLALIFSCNTSKESPPGYETPSHNLEVYNGIHTDSGLIDDPQLPIIISNCTACHSAKMITQNRATREGWKNMIVWMQSTQKLWNLGENEAVILDYLEKNYSPDSRSSRRAHLEDIEWYSLN